MGDYKKWGGGGDSRNGADDFEIGADTPLRTMPQTTLFIFCMLN